MEEISKLGWLIGLVKCNIGQLPVLLSQFAKVLHSMKKVLVSSHPTL
jgi:hypothetical protein